jgi:hypothetical protein
MYIYESTFTLFILFVPTDWKQKVERRNVIPLVPLYSIFELPVILLHCILYSYYAVV